jgi:hypothetical protein
MDFAQNSQIKTVNLSSMATAPPTPTRVSPKKDEFEDELQTHEFKVPIILEAIAENLPRLKGQNTATRVDDEPSRLSQSASSNQSKVIEEEFTKEEMDRLENETLDSELFRVESTSSADEDKNRSASFSSSQKLRKGQISLTDMSLKVPSLPHHMRIRPPV